MVWLLLVLALGWAQAEWRAWYARRQWRDAVRGWGETLDIIWKTETFYR